jgi:hypothetical protein
MDTFGLNALQSGPEGHCWAEQHAGQNPGDQPPMIFVTFTRV